MSDFASLNGARLQQAQIVFPFFGLWSADVTLADSTAVSGSCQLVVADISLQAFAYASGDDAGQRSVRLVGGFGGWRQAVEAKHYQSPGGVMQSLILGDLAREVGEQVNVSNDASVGTAYVREAAPAQRVLRQIGGSLWWVDQTGTVQVGSSRSSAPITSAFTVTQLHGGRRLYEVASEVLSDWMPGRTFTTPVITTPLQVSATTVTMTNSGQLRLEVLAAT